MAKKKQKSRRKPIKTSSQPITNPPKTSKPLFSTINWKYLVGFTLLIAFVFRLFKVGELSLWVDEYVVGSWTLAVVEGTGSPELRYNQLIAYITLAICKVFGVTEGALRFQSVLFGTLTIPIIYLLGQKLFNNFVGFLAAFLTCFSLYLIFWSRVAYNYAIAGFAFSLLLLVFLYAFEPNKKIDKNTFLGKLEIDKKYLLLFLLALIFAILSHLLCIFFFFGLGLYSLFCYINNYFDKASNIPKKINKYLPFATLGVIGSFLLFNPTFIAIAKSFLSLLFPESSVNSIIPNLERLTFLWENDRYFAFNTYSHILEYDFSYLYYVGLLGFVVSFFMNRKSSFFLLSFFGLLFLLMSFVYREPSVPRYLVYIYPLFLISIAAAVNFFFVFLPEKFVANFSTTNLKSLAYIGALVFVAIFFRFREMKDLITVKYKSSYQIDKGLSNWSYTNWKAATDYLKANMKEGDVVMSTVPQATNFYMGWSPPVSALQFRQRYLDSHQSGNYIEYEPNGTNMDARSIQGLERTVNEHPRGWLLADYYLESASTSAKARSFVYRNFNFHYGASESGDIKVLSWDHSQPRTIPSQRLLIELGRNRVMNASRVKTFTFDENPPSKENYTFELITQGINSKTEGFMVLNNEVKLMLPPNSSTGPETTRMQVNKQYFKPGKNTVQFGYEPKTVYDPQKGFAVYSMRYF